MEKIHDALHAMPLWMLILGSFLLVVASGADEESLRGKSQLIKPAATRVVDNIGSWLAFAALILFILAYFWPEGQ